jgi:hypothetical protein
MVEQLLQIGQITKYFEPPASNMAQMKENMSKYEHKDWYICTEEKPN